MFARGLGTHNAFGLQRVDSVTLHQSLQLNIFRHVDDQNSIEATDHPGFHQQRYHVDRIGGARPFQLCQQRPGFLTNQGMQNVFQRVPFIGTGEDVFPQQLPVE